ncbi:MAG: energy transducer TonB [candidate division Zixibacteria bacterium]|nr:energy transducer TonB [candidate division Zixibacteria bacterium]
MAGVLHVLAGLSWGGWSAWFGERVVAVSLAPYTDVMEIQLTEPDMKPSGPMILPSETQETPDALSEIIPVPDPIEEETPLEEMAISEPSSDQMGLSGTASSPGVGTGTGSGGKISEPTLAPPSGGPVYDERPRVLKKVEPEYPLLAKMAGIEGLVVLSILIDENGKLVEVQVVKSLGNTGCDEAAVKAVEQYVFAPATVQGKPVAARVTLPVLFSLKSVR